MNFADSWGTSASHEMPLSGTPFSETHGRISLSRLFCTTKAHNLRLGSESDSVCEPIRRLEFVQVQTKILAPLELDTVGSTPE